MTAAATVTTPFSSGAPELTGDELQPPGAARHAEAVRTIGLYLICIAVALGVTALLVVAVGHTPGQTLKALFQGSVGSQGAVGRTLDSTIPVLLVSLGTLIAVRAGMFNIGQTGQLTFGGFCAALVALKLGGPGPLVLILALIAGVLGGALWAAIAAFLYSWRRVNVVISTLLLTYIATQVLQYAVSNESLLEEPSKTQIGSLAQSAPLPAGVRLPHPGNYPHFGVSMGLVIAVVLVVAAIVLLARSRWGVHLRMVGANPVAAKRFGVRVVLVAGGALVLSGALAGLAGGTMLTGQVFRIQGGFANTFGNDGLLAALVCRDRPGWLLPVSFVFGMIRVGGNYFLATGVPYYLAHVLQGLLVLAAIFPPVYLDRREWARRLKAARFLAFKTP